jgi:hypothetical protein
VGDLLDALGDQGLIPKRPARVSPELESARTSVLALLAHYDERQAALAFDRHYPSYEPFAALEQRLQKLHAAHGTCTAGEAFEPENALRGHARLACERGGIELTVTLTSDVPPRIQSLSLESALPPSQQLLDLGARAASLLGQWDETSAAPLFANDEARNAAQREFAKAARNHGSCRTPQPHVSDGLRSATYRLGCERGELALAIRLSADGKKVETVELSQLGVAPSCPPR